MLKVKNLGNSFCSATYGLIEHNATAVLPIWEFKILIKMYKLAIVVEE